MRNPEAMYHLALSVAEKSIRKSVSLKNIAFHNPEDRVLHQLYEYKRENSTNEDEKIMVKLTRKEISNMTGLRIETVIRTIKKMEKEGRLEIKKGKIFF